MFAALDELAARMRACLGALDGGAPEDERLRENFAQVRRGFDELGDLQLLEGRIDASERPRLVRSLEELMRLNALLTVAASRDKERLLERLQQARQARSRVDSQRASGKTGSSCDVRG
ncbi:MAG: hypothetical protein GY711_04425 [bacterium]|nr:hypothetical protein [bacterium]